MLGVYKNYLLDFPDDDFPELADSDEKSKHQVDKLRRDDKEKWLQTNVAVFIQSLEQEIEKLQTKPDALFIAISELVKLSLSVAFKESALYRELLSIQSVGDLTVTRVALLKQYLVESKVAYPTANSIDQIPEFTVKVKAAQFSVFFADLIKKIQEVVINFEKNPKKLPKEVLVIQAHSALSKLFTTKLPEEFEGSLLHTKLQEISATAINNQSPTHENTTAFLADIKKLMEDSQNLAAVNMQDKEFLQALLKISINRLLAERHKNINGQTLMTIPASIKQLINTVFSQVQDGVAKIPLGIATQYLMRHEQIVGSAINIFRELYDAKPGREKNVEFVWRWLEVSLNHYDKEKNYLRLILSTMNLTVLDLPAAFKESVQFCILRDVSLAKIFSANVELLKILLTTINPTDTSSLQENNKKLFLGYLKMKTTELDDHHAKHGDKAYADFLLTIKKLADLDLPAEFKQQAQKLAIHSKYNDLLKQQIASVLVGKSIANLQVPKSKIEEPMTKIAKHDNNVKPRSIANTKRAVRLAKEANKENESPNRALKK